MKKRKKGLIIIGSIVLVLVIVRLLLPYWIKNYLNKTLDAIPGYTGSVTDVDLNLYRGAYAIDSLYIYKESVDIKEPFFATDRIDLSVQWKAIFKGALVAEIALYKPQLNFVVYQSGDTTAIQSGEEADWTQPIKDLLPISINEFRGIDGKISYIDNLADPKVNIYLNDFNFTATNISNVDDKKELPSTIIANANSIGNGKLDFNCHINLLQEIPNMDMDLTFEGASLPALNDFTRAYAKLDAEKGTFNLYSEAAIDNSQLDGYVKPVLTGIKLVDFSEDVKKPLKLIWESVAGFVLEIFENQRHDQFATKIPMKGDLKDIKSPIWPTLGGIFKNAFIKAFTKKTEDEVSFEDVLEKKKK